MMKFEKTQVISCNSFSIAKKINLTIDLLKSLMSKEKEFNLYFEQLIQNIRQLKAEYKNKINTFKKIIDQKAFMRDAIFSVGTVSQNIAGFCLKLSMRSDYQKTFQLLEPLVEIFLVMIRDIQQEPKLKPHPDIYKDFLKKLPAVLILLNADYIARNREEKNEYFEEEGLIVKIFEVLQDILPGELHIPALILANIRLQQGHIEAAHTLYEQFAKYQTKSASKEEDLKNEEHEALSFLMDVYKLFPSQVAQTLGYAFLRKEDFKVGLLYLKRAKGYWKKGKEGSEYYRIAQEIKKQKKDKLTLLKQAIDSSKYKDLIEFDKYKANILLERKYKPRLKNLPEGEWNEKGLVIEKIFELKLDELLKLLENVSQVKKRIAEEKLLEIKPAEVVQLDPKPASVAVISNNNNEDYSVTKIKEKTHAYGPTLEIPQPLKVTFHYALLFSPQYHGKHILTFGNKYIPFGIYFGFFEPEPHEEVSKKEVDHHRDIFERGLIVSGFYKQGVKFVKNKTLSKNKVNFFKTKDPTQDFRCHTKICEIVTTEENKKLYLYHFNRFKRHGE